MQCSVLCQGGQIGAVVQWYMHSLEKWVFWVPSQLDPNRWHFFWPSVLLSNCWQNCRSVTRVNRNRNRHRGGGGGAGGGPPPPTISTPAACRVQILACEHIAPGATFSLSLYTMDTQLYQMHTKFEAAQPLNSVPTEPAPPPPKGTPAPRRSIYVPMHDFFTSGLVRCAFTVHKQ